MPEAPIKYIIDTLLSNVLLPQTYNTKNCKKF